MKLIQSCSKRRWDPTCGHDESRRRVLGQDGHPPQLDVEQLAPALGQMQGAAFAELGRGAEGVM